MLSHIKSNRNGTNRISFVNRQLNVTSIVLFLIENSDSLRSDPILCKVTLILILYHPTFAKRVCLQESMSHPAYGAQ